MPRNQELPWWIALPFSIFVGILLVGAIPGALDYLQTIVAQILAILFVGVVVGVIILGIIWYIKENY